MVEKIEQSKQFIEEFDKVQGTSGAWIFAGLRTAKNNVSEYPTLYKWLFTGTSDEDKANQLTFAKIWAGEIELVEKKPKYVIYQVINDYIPLYLGGIKKYQEEVYKKSKEITMCLVYKKDINGNFVPTRRPYNMLLPEELNPYELFNQEFAFKMRDTGKFKIEEVKN